MKDAWLKARDDLRVEIYAPYELELEGLIIKAVAYLPDFGAKNGTLVFTIDQELPDNIISKNGYFFSQVNPDEYGIYNSSLFQETLNDWQWFSSQKNTPQWYTGKIWN